MLLIIHTENDIQLNAGILFEAALVRSEIIIIDDIADISVNSKRPSLTRLKEVYKSSY